MRTVTMTEAGHDLSNLVEALESGREDEIVIERDGKAVARLVVATGAGKRKAILRKILPDNWEEDWNAMDHDVAELFEQSLSREGDLLAEAVLLDPQTIRTK